MYVQEVCRERGTCLQDQQRFLWVGPVAHLNDLQWMGHAQRTADGCFLSDVGHFEV